MTFDPTKAAELVRMAMEDDERMTPGNWHAADCFSPQIVLYAVPADKAALRQVGEGDLLYLGRVYADDAGKGRQNMYGIARTRNNLRALAEQLSFAMQEIERLRESTAHGEALVELHRTSTEKADLAIALDMLEAENNDLTGSIMSLASERDSLRSQLQAAQQERDAARVERVKWVRAGFDIAQEHAEVSETDGWHRVDPHIDWAMAERKLAEFSLTLTTNREGE